MKKTTLYLALALIALINWQCRQNAKTTETEFANIELPTDYRAIFCPVELGNLESEIIRSRRFLFAHGLPSNPEELPENPDWRVVDSAYLQQNLEQMSESERSLFRRIGAIVILRNHALLDSLSEKEKIAFYTKEYVAGGGNCAGLLYFCLQAAGEQIPAKERSEYVKVVTARSAELVSRYEQWLKITKTTVNPDASPLPNDALRVDLEKTERIVQMERGFAARLKNQL